MAVHGSEVCGHACYCGEVSILYYTITKTKFTLGAETVTVTKRMYLTKAKRWTF